MGVSVLLVDDDALVRAGLRMILDSDPDITLAGEAADGAAAVGQVRALHPDIVLMDIRMPGTDGLDATAAVRALPKPPAVIVLTTFGADEYVLRAVRAGASGFLLKDTPPAEIIQAVHRVADGDAMLSPSVTRTLLDHLAAPADDDRRRRAEHRLAPLSGREREVAIQVSAGLSNAEIGARLYLSEATVKAHVSRLLTKLDVANRVHVALLIRDAGLV